MQGSFRPREQLEQILRGMETGVCGVPTGFVKAVPDSDFGSYHLLTCTSVAHETPFSQDSLCQTPLHVLLALINDIVSQCEVMLVRNTAVTLVSFRSLLT